MKIRLLSLVGITFFFSCKNDKLTNSYIYFNESQPSDVETVANFPKKYWGTFGRNYSNLLKVESSYVIKIEIESFDATIKQMDSLPNLEFRNNIVYDKATQKAYKTFVKNDTIQWESVRLDTIFSFAKDEAAKIYKSSLILNKEVNGIYLVNIIKFDSPSRIYLQLGIRKDFVKIQDQLKIPFEAHVENNDTTFIVLNPSRADFRKILGVEGFEYEQEFD